jgi:hypothetical protein
MVGCDPDTHPVVRPGKHVLRRYVACIGAAWGLMAASAPAQPPKPTEYQVKAAYLYNFGKFIAWPDKAKSLDSGNAFHVCILGDDPFGNSLDTTVSDETVDGKKVVVKRIPRVQDASSCRIVFISRSEKVRVKTIMPALDTGTALTVSDIPGFTDVGGMIEFVIEENRVRFTVNLDAAQHAGLSLSSELLKVALDVKSKGGH